MLLIIVNPSLLTITLTQSVIVGNDGFATALDLVFVGVILKDSRGAGQQDYNRRVVDHRGQELIPLNHFLTDAG